LRQFLIVSSGKRATDMGCCPLFWMPDMGCGITFRSAANLVRFRARLYDDIGIVSAAIVTINRWRVDNGRGIIPIRVLTIAWRSIYHRWRVRAAVCQFTLIGPGWVGVIAVATIVMDAVRTALALCAADCLCNSRRRCIRGGLFRIMVVCCHRDTADKKGGECGSADDSYTE
jgi:hypothetical protein